MKQKEEINLEYELFILLNNIIQDVNDSDNEYDYIDNNINKW